MKQAIIGLILLIGAAGAGADQTFPATDWQDAPNPLASPFAEKGGRLVVYAGPYPKSLNYYLDQNVTSLEIFGSLYETLLSQHPVSLEMEPFLADQWTLSDDRKTFTFHLDPKAQWSDGQPITAEDVRWTFETILAPKNLTGPHKIALERFESPEVVDEHTIRFTAKKVHWENLLALGGLQILPKHAYAGQDFNLVNFEFPVVSGSYTLGTIKEGIYLTLERRTNWWARDFKRTQGTGNFDELRLRFFEEQDNAFEAFMKGEIDLYPVYKADQWAKQTTGEKFEKNWIVKQPIYNYKPIGMQGLALNLRRDIFKDPLVRQALARLYDRRKMNETIMHNAYFLHRSYFEDLYAKDTPCPNELIEFDKEKARELLKEAGWAANPKTGVLEKDGQPFKIQLLSRGGQEEKFIAIFKEDLKDVGIELEIVKKDWAAWAKDMDTYNFDLTWAAWSGGLFKDPESMWYSQEADRPSGQNITGFRNAKVDELVERQRAIFDVQERHAIVREIDQLLAQEIPYILLWNLNYVRLLYWNKFGTPPTVLSKYGDERAAYSYWWHDPDAEADLQHAMETGRALPKKPAEIRYDDLAPGATQP